MESNKLIADFMGVNIITLDDIRTNKNPYISSADGYLEDDLAYHEDWKRWLKPVVEKIDDYLFENVGKVGYFDECLSSNELDVTYQAVVEFINQLKNK